MVIGAGQNGMLHLLDETIKMLEDKSIKVIDLETPDVINFNQRVQTQKKNNRDISMLHVNLYLNQNTEE